MLELEPPCLGWVRAYLRPAKRSRTSWAEAFATTSFVRLMSLIFADCSVTLWETIEKPTGPNQRDILQFPKPTEIKYEAVRRPPEGLQISTGVPPSTKAFLDYKRWNVFSDGGGSQVMLRKRTEVGPFSDRLGWIICPTHPYPWRVRLGKPREDGDKLINWFYSAVYNQNTVPTFWKTDDMIFHWQYNNSPKWLHLNSVTVDFETHTTPATKVDWTRSM